MWMKISILKEFAQEFEKRARDKKIFLQFDCEGVEKMHYHCEKRVMDMAILASFIIEIYQDEIKKLKNK